MKSKTFSKKLTLNKKTVADLSIDKMKNVLGGALITYGCWQSPVNCTVDCSFPTGVNCGDCR
jgi:hypothetical protein